MEKLQRRNSNGQFGKRIVQATHLQFRVFEHEPVDVGRIFDAQQNPRISSAYYEKREC